MDVNISNMQDLFVTPVRYEIPSFQRAYIWNKEKQWDPLWEDVQNMAEATLEDSKLSGHFLGAIVLQQKPVPTPMFQHRIVVDGQQRLITLQLLLDTVGDVFEEYGDKDASSRLHELVNNSKYRQGGNPDNRFKVWPTKTDQNAFRYAMSNECEISKYNYQKNEISPIVECHNYFEQQIRQWLNEQPDINEKIKALEQTVTQLLELVVIDLGDSDNPHVIFETLNARGTPLLQSDLVKNMLQYEASKLHTHNDQDEDTDQFWSFQDVWWRKKIRQGRILRPRVDVFLYYWMVMEKVDELTPGKVFSEFRKYYNDKDIQSVIEDMNNFGRIYRKCEKSPDPILESPDPILERFMYRIKTMQTGALYPVLLWLLSINISQQQLQKGLRALESHQIRRMICRMNTRGYNRLFVNLLKELKVEGGLYPGDLIIEYLNNQESNVGLWPSDEQFADDFINLPLYKLLTRGRLRIVLEGIEEELRTAKTEIQSAPHDLTIEHIMPQQWQQHWQILPADVDNAIEERNRIIHSIGNLTLVNNRLNADLSNAPWEKKRQTLEEHSVLFLNKALLHNAPDVWDENAILKRGKQLCEVAKKVWPKPT